MLFILAIGDRQRASSRLRVWDHLDFLADVEGPLHFDCVVPTALARHKGRLFLRLVLRLPLWALWFARARVVYIQETLILWPLISFAALLGSKRVIFDFSDPVDAIGSGWRLRIRLLAFDMMVRSAKAVLVENRYYQRKLSDRNVSQAYGPVDVGRYQKSRTESASRGLSSRLRVGWTGSPSTLRFIEPLFAPLDALAAEFEIELVLIGVSGSGYSFQQLPVTCLPWSEEVEFREVPQFDLGLHSLDQTDLSLKRGAGKIFIYMAAGVPFITDARGIGLDVITESGAGVPVANPTDWLERLRHIISSRQERHEHAKRGLEFARAEISYEVFRALLKKLLSEASDGIR